MGAPWRKSVSSRQAGGTDVRRIVSPENTFDNVFVLEATLSGVTGDNTNSWLTLQYLRVWRGVRNGQGSRGPQHNQWGSRVPSVAGAHGLAEIPGGAGAHGVVGATREHMSADTRDAVCSGRWPMAGRERNTPRRGICRHLRSWRPEVVLRSMSWYWVRLRVLLHEGVLWAERNLKRPERPGRRFSEYPKASASEAGGLDHRSSLRPRVRHWGIVADKTHHHDRNLTHSMKSECEPRAPSVKAGLGARGGNPLERRMQNSQS